MRCHRLALIYTVAFAVTSRTLFGQSADDDLGYEHERIISASALIPCNLPIEEIPRQTAWSQTDVEHCEQIQRHLTETVQRLRLLGMMTEADKTEQLRQQIKNKLSQSLLDHLKSKFKAQEMENARLRQSKTAVICKFADVEESPKRLIAGRIDQRHLTSRNENLTNQQLAENIAKTLRGKVRGELEIEVKDGIARLDGSTLTAEMRDEATILTSEVAGVGHVVNSLRIPEKNPKSSGEEKTPSDMEVAERIGQVLSDANFDSYDIQIRFKKGTATLLGRVHSKADRRLVAELASQVPGVRIVIDSLECDDEPGK